MIQIMFEFLGDIELVIIDGNRVLFGNTSFGARFADIDGLKLSYEGTIREFPDLEMEDEWREIAIQRLKDKIKSQTSERETALYVADELKKFGHIPLKIQMSGCRWRNLE